MQGHRRISAHGVGRDETGRVLLVRSGSGGWNLPGITVRHGENPAIALSRAVANQTGLAATVGDIRDVVTELRRASDAPVPAFHHDDRLIFDLRFSDVLNDGGDLRHDRAAWLDLDGPGAIALSAAVARALGRTPSESWPADRPAEHATSEGEPTGQPVPRSLVPRRRQRFAAYGLVTDPEQRILLSLIATGYPGAGQWHLPGGGTDFGESAAAGLIREVFEETGQHGEVRALLHVSDHHRRRAFGPEGVAIDWHSVRVVFRAVVTEPTPPRVVETAGSTVAAQWCGVVDALRLPLTQLARQMIVAHASA